VSVKTNPAISTAIVEGRLFGRVVDGLDLDGVKALGVISDGNRTALAALPRPDRRSFTLRERG